MKNPLQIFKNLNGKLKGVSGCHHCGDTWDWKAVHEIPFYASKERSHTDGAPYYSRHMFPLCEECYQELSPADRYYYCVQLATSWGKKGYETVDWEIVKQHIGFNTSAETMTEEKE